MLQYTRAERVTVTLKVLTFVFNMAVGE